MFVSKDRQLKAIHLILDFEPILENFQEVSHAIRAGDPRLCRIDESVPGFLAREDVMPAELSPILALQRQWLRRKKLLPHAYHLRRK